MIGEPGEAADIVVRVIVVLTMVQAIPNTRKENMNSIITIKTRANINKTLSQLKWYCSNQSYQIPGKIGSSSSPLPPIWR